MSQRLFNVAKVPVQLDAVTFGIEKRRGEDKKIVNLVLRIQPFDAKLASALDAGVGEDSNIKATVFSLNSGEPKPAFIRHDFVLSLARQNLELYASSDTTESRICITQAKISGTYVRTQKDMPSALAFVFRASFGPVGRDELEYLNLWFRAAQNVTFRESEKSLDFQELGEDVSGEDEDAGAEEQPGLPAHEFDTDAEGHAIEKAEPINRRLHSPARGKKKGVAKPKARRRRGH